MENDFLESFLGDPRFFDEVLPLVLDNQDNDSEDVNHLNYTLNVLNDLPPQNMPETAQTLFGSSTQPVAESTSINAPRIQSHGETANPAFASSNNLPVNEPV